VIIDTYVYVDINAHADGAVVLTYCS